MPLGDGHGPDIVGPRAERFLTTPEQRARVEALVKQHAEDLDKLTDPMEQAEAAMAVAEWAAKKLASVAALHPTVAPFAGLAQRFISTADKLRSEGGTH